MGGLSPCGLVVWLDAGEQQQDLASHHLRHLSLPAQASPSPVVSQLLAPRQYEGLGTEAGLGWDGKGHDGTGWNGMGERTAAAAGWLWDDPSSPGSPQGSPTTAAGRVSGLS